MSTSQPALLQLLRLCSPALPIGSYAYSQGLESACENDYVDDENSLAAWIKGVMQTSMLHLDIPLFARLYDAHACDRATELTQWNNFLLASRETKELYFEDTQMGNALVKLLHNLDVDRAEPWIKKECTLATAFSLACAHWHVDKSAAMHGFVWAWCENQVSIGVKLIPLGQTSGQRIISRLVPAIEQAIADGLLLDDSQLGASCPGLVIASMQHEDQYTRLFRS
jgi:urease accessory protein